MNSVDKNYYKGLSKSLLQPFNFVLFIAKVKVEIFHKNSNTKSYETKQLLTSVSVDIRIYQPSKMIFNSVSCLGEYHFFGLINPYVSRNLSQ